MRIGVDVGGTKIEAVALNDDDREVARIRRPTPAGDYHGFVDSVAGLVVEIEEIAGPAAIIGIATPGAIDPISGRLKNSNSVVLNGQQVAQDLAAAIGRPIHIANDADCFALSEAIDGAAVGARSVFGVILGTGVGGGIVIDGTLVQGPNAIAGEWGHNPLPWPGPDETPGPACYCGLSGCIETFISGPGMALSHLAQTGEHLSASQIATAAATGEPHASATLARFADRLARALASVINILDPEVIVLGGGVSNIAALYDLVPERWAPYVFSESVNTRLVRAKHGDSSGVRGAARLGTG